MNLKNILLSCVLIFGSLSLSGCYTQLSMFHPDPEVEEEQFYSFSVARVRPNISLHAQDGAGQSLGMAYQMMYNRFSGFMGYGNRYSYYNPYYYGGYYNDFITLKVEHIRFGFQVLKNIHQDFGQQIEVVIHQQQN